MDRIVDKLPEAVRTKIRPDPFGQPHAEETLKKDALDYRREQTASGYTGNPTTRKTIEIVFSAVNGYVDLLVASQTRPDLDQFIAGTIIPSAVVIGRLFKDKANYRYSENAIYSDIYTEGGYRISNRQFKYSGKEVLKTPGVELAKGDTFYYLNLPEIQQEKRNITPELIANWLYQIDTALNTFWFVNEEKDFKAVAIEMPTVTFPWGDIDIEAQTKTRREVLANKRVPLKDADTKVILLSKEDFRELLVKPDDILKNAVEQLGDPLMQRLIGNSEYSLARPSKAKTRELITKQATRILRREIEANFNGPETLMRRDESYNPYREKVHPLSRLAQTQLGYSFIQTVGLTGEVRNTPLNRLLKVGEDLQGVIKNPGKFKKAQMAYIIQQIMRFYDVNDLRNREYPPADHGPYTLKDPEHRLDRFVDLKKEERQRVGYRALRNMRTILSSFVIYAAIKTGGLAGLDAGKDYYKSLQTPEVSNAAFVKGVPRAGLEWKINGSNTDGYYILATSSNFRDGRWVDNTNVAKTYALPEAVPQQLNHSRLEKTIPLEQIGDTRIRIPLRDYSKLVAIKVTGKNETSIKNYIREFDDGTVELVVPFSVLGNGSWAKIEATLEETDKPVVKAPNKIPKINTSKLSPQAREYADAAKSIMPDDTTNYLRSRIRTEKTYSLYPPGAEELNVARTPEEYVNAQAHLESCECTTCNTMLALLNTADDDAPAVNIAFGFMASNSHVVGRLDGYLRTETGHAFGIDGSGRIQDATPTRIANDPDTKAYIELLRKTSVSGLTATGLVENEKQKDLWEEKIKKVKEDADYEKQKNDLLKIAGVTAGGIAGLAVTLKAARMLNSRKKRESKVEPEKATPEPAQFPEPTLPQYNELVFLGVDRDGMQRAVNFFSWLSFGNHNVPTNMDISSLKEESGEQVFKKIQDNINPYKVAQYLEDPKAYERHYVLGEEETKRLREIAAYLVE